MVGDSSAPSQITHLLRAWTEGDARALEALTPLVQRELHRLAVHYMAGERQGHVLQPTALVNEAYVRLVAWTDANWQNRAHFFAMAACIMRGVLVDHARKRGRLRRGGGNVQVSLSHAEDVPVVGRAPDLVALDDALEAFATFDPRKARVVELRFFGGLSLEEIAHVLDVSVGTVRRDWGLARAWLSRELARQPV
ncbi:MAG: sigma-70 family RNA polymerase sigma factor [Vicinamibacterales bacterium]